MSDKPVVSRVERGVTLVNNILSDIEGMLNQQTPEEAMASMALSILEAETFADMFVSSGVDNLHESLMDIGLEVTGISFNRSTFGQGLPFYATFTGTKLEDGEEFIANCGAWQTVLVGYKCVKNGWLPRQFCFHRSDKPTAQGFYPVNILPWGQYENEEPF